MNNVTNAKEKPVLDPERFQRLLAAAFMLQSQNDPRPPEPIGGGRSRTFGIPGIVQKRTPSLRQTSLQRGRLKPLVQFAKPRLWRAVEALAVATVFSTSLWPPCGMIRSAYRFVESHLYVATLRGRLWPRCELPVRARR